MSAKIQVRPVNPQTCQTLIAAGADPPATSQPTPGKWAVAAFIMAGL